MGENIPDSPGKRVAKLREERGWKQRQLAEKAEISITFLSEVENDKRSMGSDVLLRVADALGVSLDYIVKGEVGTPPPEKPLMIPHELEKAGEEQDWSLRTIKDLLSFHDFVVARRGEEKGADSKERKLTKNEWIKFYDKYKSLTDE